MDEDFSTAQNRSQFKMKFQYWLDITGWSSVTCTMGISHWLSFISLSLRPSLPPFFPFCLLPSLPFSCPTDLLLFLPPCPIPELVTCISPPHCINVNQFNSQGLCNVLDLLLSVNGILPNKSAFYLWWHLAKVLKFIFLLLLRSISLAGFTTYTLWSVH